SNRVVFISASEVDWIESAANYALLHAGDKTHVVRETMHALETKLSPKIFQRISRSVIVNLERVRELQPMGKGQYVIILTNGKQLTMSRGIRDLEQAVQSHSFPSPLFPHPSQTARVCPISMARSNRKA